MAQDKEFHIDKLLETVLDNMLEGFQVISRDWEYLYVNNSVADQGKKSKAELIGKTMMECYPGIDKTPLFEQLKKAQDQKVSIRMENEFKFPDGSSGWFELYIHPWAEGIIIFSIDITDRKTAENKLYGKIKELNILTNVSVRREFTMASLKTAIEKLEELVPDSDPRIIGMVESQTQVSLK